VLIGLVVATVGFFGAHAIATGWAGRGATVGKAQASSLYNLFYYGGSSAVGWFGGVAFDAAGWNAVAAVVIGLAVMAGLLACTITTTRYRDRTPTPAAVRSSAAATPR
jgi:predicted MFS family arabinose efflux permease